MKFRTVSVIGLGYIGLPTATLLAQHKVNVVGVDVSQYVVDFINAGKLHIVEPGLDTVLKSVVQKGHLRATTIPEPADVFIIAVPTPLTDEHKPDISYIRAAANSIAPVLKKGDLVILESTSPVGTTERLAKWLFEARSDLTFPQQAANDADVQVAYCPERVLPGNVLLELVSNDRVIGGMSAKASDMAARLYKIFIKGEVAITNSRTSEMCKLAENSFRDVNIAFANELSMVCDVHDIDIWELISLSNRHPRVNILQPSCGVGGHCIAVDPWFIVDSAPKEARLIRTAREVNGNKPEWVLEKVKSAIADVLLNSPEKRIADVTVAGLGLAFKPDIDDLRESPAVYLAENIAKLGCRFLAIAPYIRSLPQALSSLGIKLSTLRAALKEADIVCVLVHHTNFIEFTEEILQHSNVIDTVGLIWEHKQHQKYQHK